MLFGALHDTPYLILYLCMVCIANGLHNRVTNILIGQELVSYLIILRFTSLLLTGFLLESSLDKLRELTNLNCEKYLVKIGVKMETIELSTNFRSIRSNENSQHEPISGISRSSHGLRKKIITISVLTLSLIVVLFIGVSWVLKIHPTPWNNELDIGE